MFNKHSIDFIFIDLNVLFIIIGINHSSILIIIAAGHSQLPSNTQQLATLIKNVQSQVWVYSDFYSSALKRDSFNQNLQLELPVLLKKKKKHYLTTSELMVGLSPKFYTSSICLWRFWMSLFFYFFYCCSRPVLWQTLSIIQYIHVS